MLENTNFGKSLPKSPSPPTTRPVNSRQSHRVRSPSSTGYLVIVSSLFHEEFTFTKPKCLEHSRKSTTTRQSAKVDIYRERRCFVFSLDLFVLTPGNRSDPVHEEHLPLSLRVTRPGPVSIPPLPPRERVDERSTIDRVSSAKGPRPTLVHTTCSVVPRTLVCEGI